jgi:AAA+ ATPase superfamily predicted ATPase
VGAFYNRDQELAALADAWESNKAELALLYGRRRVGKTYMLQHFLSNDRPHCYFLASAMSIADNIAQLAEALIAAHPGAAGMTVADIPTLRSALQFYETIARERRSALVIDEFQYLVAQDPSIPSQIQAWWDTAGIRSQAYVVLCGSHIGTMEALAGASQPLYGRFTLRQRLKPMSYDDTALFYQDGKWSGRDKLIAYGVLGGTPKYHATFSDKLSLGANIVRHVLSPSGLLNAEPEVMIASSSIRDPALYNSVLHAIAQGETRRSNIEQRTGLTHSQFGFYSQSLMDMEWIDREAPFGDVSGKRSIYRITDHFIHFWYRFVSTLASELEFRDTAEVYRTRVEPYLNDYMGRYVFEDICMQYLRKHGANRHGLQIRNAGRYWSRDGAVEVDIVGSLDDGRVLACECKWSSSPVGVGVYYDLMRKSSLLPQPTDSALFQYALFSAAGFDADMVATAARDDVVLVSGDDLLRGFS